MSRPGEKTDRKLKTVIWCLVDPQTSTGRIPPVVLSAPFKSTPLLSTGNLAQLGRILKVCSGRLPS